MAEIKINELSVGDWVRFEGKPYKVIGIEKWRPNYVVVLENWREIYTRGIKCISPIPLTPEILEKNGFVKSSENCWSNPSIECACLRYGTKYWDIRTGGRNRAYRPTRISIDNILHMHQLQHAMRLAGVEKEIEV